jgi:hypothetical protein
VIGQQIWQAREGEAIMDKARTDKARTAIFLPMAGVLAATLWLAPVLFGDVARAAQPGFTTDFRLEDCTWDDRGRNPYFSLNPGDTLTLAGEDNGEKVKVEITVLRETLDITFETLKGTQLTVKTRQVREREWIDDVLVEESINYFARCEQTNDILYFGEDVIPPAGSWLAGQGGAFPGLIMPGTFLLGSRYFQEIAPDVALDRAEHIATGLTITVPTVPAQTFEDCVEVLETTPLEPASKSTKRYCPGVGLVFDDGVELVDFTLGNN